MTATDAAGQELLQRLEALLDSCRDQTRDVRAALKQWHTVRPEELARAGILYLGRATSGPTEKYLAQLLTSNRVYMKYLLSPALTGPEAVAAAGALAQADPAFFRRLVETADDRPETIYRTFEIIRTLDRASIVVPWLQRMTRHPDPRVQSKASLIFCGLYANPLLVERQLASADPRVRANAIEALWHVDKVTCRALLEKAIGDPHHRVALNAALGLYYLNRAAATDQMIAFAAHRDPCFRAATAWAMGQTGDPAFERYLQALASDAEENVRSSAQRALSAAQKS
jgi:hypothetical protein